MTSKPAPIPTMKEVIWALYRAMTETRTPLHKVWLCKDQGYCRFWNKVEDYLSEDLYWDMLYERDTQDPICRSWVRRFIINNWAEVAIELQTLSTWGPLNVLNSDIQREMMEQKEVQTMTRTIMKALDDEAA